MLSRSLGEGKSPLLLFVYVRQSQKPKTTQKAPQKNESVWNSFQQLRSHSRRLMSSKDTTAFPHLCALPCAARCREASAGRLSLVERPDTGRSGCCESDPSAILFTRLAPQKQVVSPPCPPLHTAVHTFTHTPSPTPSPSRQTNYRKRAAERGEWSGDDAEKMPPPPSLYSVCPPVHFSWLLLCYSTACAGLA